MRKTVLYILLAIESVIVLLGLTATVSERYSGMPFLSLIVSTTIGTYLFFCVCIFLKPKSSYYVFLISGALMLSIFICNAFLKDYSGETLGIVGKVLLFVVISTLAASFFYDFLLKKNHKSLYWITATISAVIITILAIVLNSYWHYLGFNALFPEPVCDWKTDYMTFIENDITYNIGFIAPIRYPALFLFVIFAFLVGFIIYRKNRVLTESEELLCDARKDD